MVQQLQHTEGPYEQKWIQQSGNGRFGKSEILKFSEQPKPVIAILNQWPKVTKFKFSRHIHYKIFYTRGQKFKPKPRLKEYLADVTSLPYIKRPYPFTVFHTIGQES